MKNSKIKKMQYSIQILPLSSFLVIFLVAEHRLIGHQSQSLVFIYAESDVQHPKALDMP